VAVNGHAIGSIAATVRWSRSLLPVSRALLVSGLNRLTLLWPDPQAGGDPLAAAIERLDAGLTADLHPVFGELFSLRAAPATL